MQVVNYFISSEEQKELYEYVSGNKMPYRIYPTHIFNEDSLLKDKVHAPQQLTHFMYMHGEDNSSPHIKVIRPIFDKLQSWLGPITLFRVKVNVTFPSPGYNNYQAQVAHTDMAYEDGRKVPHEVFLYYINDSDGPTYFFNEKYELTDAVEPKMGRGVLFDGSKLHAGSSPVHNSFRFALNINFRRGINQIP